MKTPAWIVRHANADDRDRAISLMNRAFQFEQPDPNAAARWNWLFLENSAEIERRYIVADAGGVLAGQIATILLRMQYEGRKINGLLTVDGATNPDFGRQGVFSTLAKTLFEENKEIAPIVYGFPNYKSAPALVQNAGWVRVKPYPMLIRPIGNLRPIVRNWRPKLAPVAFLVDLFSPFLKWYGAFSHWLSSRGDSGEIREFKDFGPWANRLWEKISPVAGTCVIRDSAFLSWRYCESPYQYRKFSLERNGEIVGFAVLAFIPWRGGKLAYLMEFLVDPKNSSAARHLASAMVLEATKEGASAVCAIATRRHPHWRALLLQGFFPAPGELMSKRNFGVRLNGPGVDAARLFDAGTWFVSGADFDFM